MAHFWAIIPVERPIRVGKLEDYFTSKEDISVKFVSSVSNDLIWFD
jgi:hypothetical protein